MELPDNLKYSTDHEWISVNGKIGTIGITDYAQSELGDIVFIDIDPELAEIKKGEPVGTIEAVKTVSDILGPYTGKVVEVNKVVIDSPEIINSDPYGEGWMIKAEISDSAELEALLDSKAYKDLLGQES